MAKTSAIAALMRGPMLAAHPAPASGPSYVLDDGLADPDEPGITAKQRANRRHYRKIKEARMRRVKCCPFCRFEDVEIDELTPGRFAVTCAECLAIGPVSDVSVQAAIMFWNIRHG